MVSIQRSSQKSYPLYFGLPAIAVFATLFLVPTITSFYYSLTNWNIHARTTEFI